MIDEEYVAARNLLIPEAEKFAYEIAGTSSESFTVKEREIWVGRWNKAFFSCMDMLARQTGLIK